MTANIKDVEIKQATEQDVRLFFPDGVPRTCHAWVASYRGKPACLAGLIVERSGCVAFSDILPDVKAPRMTIWRTALVLLEHIKSLDLPMYTGCDIDNKTAQRFVEALGFISQRKFQGMELYIWQA